MWSKSKIWSKMENCCQNSKMWSKIKKKIGQKLKFWTNMENFVIDKKLAKNRKVGQKMKIWSKI